LGKTLQVISFSITSGSHREQSPRGPQEDARLQAGKRCSPKVDFPIIKTGQTQVSNTDDNLFHKLKIRTILYRLSDKFLDCLQMSKIIVNNKKREMVKTTISNSGRRFR